MEKQLQSLTEAQMPAFLGIHLLATEYATGKTHKGWIDALAGYLNALGDEVQEKHLKLYTAFRRLKNFAFVISYRDKLLVMLKLDPDTVALEEGFSRDTRNIGTWARATWS